MTQSASSPTRAIVLSGGGARGAYEAGVLAYLFQELPQQLFDTPRIQIFCGTSVGALHSCYLSGIAHLPRHRAGSLVRTWRAMRIDRALRLQVGDVMKLPRELYSLFVRPREATGVLFNSKLLQGVVIREVPWKQIHRNVRSGAVRAVTVSATHVSTGRTTVFVDRTEGGVPPWTRDRRVVARAVRIGPLHAMASGAIPFLFPSIAIDGEYYCDGGLRQNTPLSPALRLGADRVLVIGLRQEEVRNAGPRTSEGGEYYPTPGYLAGKIADALMLDHLDYDLSRLAGYNALLRDGMQAFGPKFVDRMSEMALRTRGARYRDIQTVLIRPTRDIGAMASRFVSENHPSFGGLPGWLLSKLSASPSLANSDLISFILFDGRFAEELIELGKHDAHACREQLIDFLKD